MKESVWPDRRGVSRHLSSRLLQKDHAVWVPQHRFGNGCGFAWIREQSVMAEEDGGIGNPSSWPAEPQERDREAANRAFRQMLRSDF